MSRTTKRRCGRRIRRIAGAIFVLVTQACGGSDNNGTRSTQGTHGDPARQSSSDLADQRLKMVEYQLKSRGIRDRKVLAAMQKVRRHRFAPDLDPAKAYADRPHSIGEGQTISQPFIVALMSELAKLQPPCQVLEIGTGSGYQAAVLAEMGCSVYTIEIIETLANRARETLSAEGYGDRVQGRFGDGYVGWPEYAPFDAVLVTAAAPRIPQPLLDQLRIGGRLVIPVGDHWQVLEVHRRTKDGFERERVSDVRFVPMTGEVRRTLDE
jgi:protein-L-isoaspartate(D-aspartate) O-methyltransferase